MVVVALVVVIRLLLAWKCSALYRSRWTMPHYTLLTYCTRLLYFLFFDAWSDDWHTEDVETSELRHASEAVGRHTPVDSRVTERQRGQPQRSTIIDAQLGVDREIQVVLEPGDRRTRYPASTTLQGHWHAFEHWLVRRTLDDAWPSCSRKHTV